MSGWVAIAVDRYSRRMGHWQLGRTFITPRSGASSIPSIRTCSRCLLRRATSSTTAADGLAITGRGWRWATRAPFARVVSLSIAVVTASCAGPTPSPVSLAHHALPAIAASGVATGGIIRFDGRCVWLETETGASNLIWPARFLAVAPPLAVIGLSGRVIVREGDTVELGVSDAKQMVPGCPARAAFFIGEISK